MPRSGWLAIGAIGGALLVQLEPPLVVLAIGALACVTAASAALRDRHVATAALAATAAIVLIRGGVGLALGGGATHASEAPAANEHEAVVLSIGTPSNGQQRATIELRPPEAPDRVYATLARYPPVVPGDIIRFTGDPEPAPTDTGFGEFLARSGIPYTAMLREFELVGADSSPLAALEGVRRAAARSIGLALPEPQAGLAAAMSIGLRDLVPRDVSAAFRASGLSHVVAISGWHIAMLGAVVGGLLGGIGRRPRSALVLTAICAYSILAGASPSILRAGVMAAVVLLARESGRRGGAAAGLGLTVASMLAIDPATIEDIGFQLSVAATAGLLVWANRLTSWLQSRLPRRAPGWLVESLGVSLAAQAATLPLVLYHFGSLSLVAPLANLLVAPLVAPAMLLTAIALVAGLVIGAGMPAVVFAPIILAGAVGIGGMIQIAHWSASLPFATVAIPSPLHLVLAALCAAALCWMVWRRPQGVPDAVGEHETAPGAVGHRVLLAGSAACLAVLLVLVNGSRPDGRLHVTVLDVGQGDSILLQGPSGGRMLVDTGPDPDRLLTLLDQRIPAWDRRLDMVVLTHPHEDHVAGLALLLDRYRIDEIVEPGMVGAGPGDEAYRRRLAELGRQSRILAGGEALRLDGIRLSVEWPLPGTVPLRPPDTGTAVNNVSIVLDLHFGARRMLLAGDVEEQIDPRLLAAGLSTPERGRLDVLKVAHHGSRTATTDAFVEQMRPSVAVISAGWGNPYGHPSPRTVERLRETGARVLRTDVDGSVEISTDGSDLVVAADGGRPHPATPAPPTPPPAGFCPIGPTNQARSRPPGVSNLQSA